MKYIIDIPNSDLASDMNFYLSKIIEIENISNRIVFTSSHNKETICSKLANKCQSIDCYFESFIECPFNNKKDCMDITKENWHSIIKEINHV